MGGDGLPGEAVHLHGPDQTLPVPGGQERRPLGVHRPEGLPEGLAPRPVVLRLQLRAEAGLRRGGGVPVPPQQPVDIEAGAAHHDGQPAPPADILHAGGGHVGVFRGGEGLLGLRHVQHVVGHTPALSLGGLRGADVHAAVHLHGIGGDHLAPEGQGRLRPQGGLARGGGAGDHQKIIHSSSVPRTSRYTGTGSSPG